MMPPQGLVFGALDRELRTAVALASRRVQARISASHFPPPEQIWANVFARQQQALEERPERAQEASSGVRR
jgi:hypothetical protein